MQRLSANSTGTSMARRISLPKPSSAFRKFIAKKSRGPAGRLGRMLSDKHSAAACPLAEGGTHQVLDDHCEQRERGERRRAQGGVIAHVCGMP